MPERYQGIYLIRCGSMDNSGCIAMAIEERRQRNKGLSGRIVVRDRCKHPELPCSTTVVADEADRTALLKLGYQLIDTLDHAVSDE